MANQQLVDYLVSLQTTKHSKTQVKRILLEVGWPEHEVNEAFRVIEIQGIRHPRFSEAQTSTLLQFAAVFLVILTGGFLIFGSQPTTTGQVILNVNQIEANQMENLPAPPATGVIVFEEPQPPILSAVPPAPIIIQTLPPVIPAPQPIPQIKQAEQTQPAPNPASQDCEVLSGFSRDNCFTAQAEQKNDERICNRIREPVRHSLCIQGIAINKKQKALCHSTDNADLCYAGYAKALKDNSACSRITNGQDRDACTASLL